MLENGKAVGTFSLQYTGTDRYLHPQFYSIEEPDQHCTGLGVLRDSNLLAVPNVKSAVKLPSIGVGNLHSTGRI